MDKVPKDVPAQPRTRRQGRRESDPEVLQIFRKQLPADGAPRKWNFGVPEDEAQDFKHSPRDAANRDPYTQVHRDLDAVYHRDQDVAHRDQFDAVHRDQNAVYREQDAIYRDAVYQNAVYRDQDAVHRDGSDADIEDAPPKSERKVRFAESKDETLKPKSRNANPETGYQEGEGYVDSERNVSLLPGPGYTVQKGKPKEENGKGEKKIEIGGLEKIKQRAKQHNKHIPLLSKGGGQNNVAQLPIQPEAVKNKDASEYHLGNEQESPAESNRPIAANNNTGPFLHTLTVPPEPDGSEEADTIAIEGSDGKTVIPKRKRSYSDGNIFFNIYEVRYNSEDSQPYIHAKTPEVTTEKEEVYSQSQGEKEAHDKENRQKKQPKVKSGWPETQESSAGPNFEDYFTVPRDETYIVISDDDEEKENNKDTRSSFPRPLPKLPDADKTLSPPPRRRADFSSFRGGAASRGSVSDVRKSTSDVRSPTTTSDVIISPRTQRRNGTATPADIQLSPSLKRRLDTNSPMRGLVADNSAPSSFDISYSPSLSRRLADRSQSRQQGAVGDSEAKASPRQPHRDSSDKTKPKPKTGATKKAAPNKSPRRPLRRSRSELFIDQSVYVIARDPSDFPDDARATRRGSDVLPSMAGGSSDYYGMRPAQRWDSLVFGLATTSDEREEMSRQKRLQLVTSLRNRQQEVDNDASQRIRTFLMRYDDA